MKGTLLRICAVVAVLLVPGLASAHVLKIDGAIGAVLHINPDDSPTSGVPVSYVLYFNDTAGHFSLPRCDCTVVITEAGAAAITTKPLVVSSAQVISNTVTFPKPDVYNLIVTGKPKTAGAFQPFTLNYLVRVTGSSNTAQPFPMLLWLGIALGIGLILLAAYAMEYSSDTTDYKEPK